MVRVTTTVALIALALACAAAPARAAHVFSFAIGGPDSSPISRPGGIAVDNSTGPSAHAIYVTDANRNRVVKFDTSGNFLLMFGDGVNLSTGADVCTAASGDVCGAGQQAWISGAAPQGFTEPRLVAVDGSAGPSAGDVYVADGLYVSRFDSSGVPDPTWGEDGSQWVGGRWIGGLAIDSNGTPVVLTSEVEGSGASEHDFLALREFSQAGVLTGAVQVDAWIHTFGLAIDAARNRYLVGPGAEAHRYTVAGNDLGRYKAQYQAHGVAVDPSESHLYVSEGAGTISRFATTCANPATCQASEVFGEGYLPLNGEGAFGALAVDNSTNTVYVTSSPYWSDGEISVFRTAGSIPEATTGPTARPSRRTVVFEADVAPMAGGPIASCRFEYVDRSELERKSWTEARSVPCAAAPPYAGATHVTGSTADFAAGRIYLYRVVVANAAGRRTGLARRFESGTRIETSTGEAIGVSDKEATLTGSVDPDPAVNGVDCFFEYFEEGRLGQPGWSEPRRAQCAPAAPYPKPTGVTGRASRLEPGRTYRYRIVTWDTWGYAAGVERSFTTAGTPLLEPEGEDPPDRRKKKNRAKTSKKTEVRCAGRACSRILRGSGRPQTWRSPKFPHTYGWLFSVYRNGESLRHTRPAGGCVSTFSGHGMIATLNGCRGRFKLTYIGRGEFKVRWRVFEHCRCGDSARRRD